MTIRVTRNDVELLSTILSLFKDVNDVTISQGYNKTNNATKLEVVFDTSINGVPGMFKVDLSDIHSIKNTSPRPAVSGA